MDDILTLSQRVWNSIALGESHFREFKTALEGKPECKHPRLVKHIARDIGKALVAFANGDGGELLIGVEDDGTITGLKHSDKDITQMLEAPKSQILDYDTTFPIQKNEVLTIDNKKILYFSVSKGINKIYQLSDGRCMKRQDKSSVPVSLHRLAFERQEQLSRECDRIFIDEATTSDLDIDLVLTVANDYIQGMSAEQYLQQVNVAEFGLGGLRLRRAALLLFAKDIQKWFPRCQVRIMRINGNKIETGSKYNVISDEYVTGNIFELLNRSWERLSPYLSQKVVFGLDAKFEQTFSYPENACREALINAIAHRSYVIQNPINVYLFDNRLVFESPGELLSTISVDELRKGVGVHESRNTFIAKILRENKYMRELGEGIRRIFEILEKQELAAPEIDSDNNVFSIALHHKSIYSDTELAWLSTYERFDLDANQKKIIVAGMNGKELSQNNIYESIRTDDRNIYDRCVTALRLKGILSEIRTNTQAKNIAYRQKNKKQDVPRFIIISASEISSESSDNKMVYISNVPNNCLQSKLHSAMSIFGKVIDVRIPLSRDNPQVNRGFAFVEFEESTASLKALAIKNVMIDDQLITIIPYRPFKY